MRLAEQTCVPCKSGTRPLEGDAAAALARQIPEWKLSADHHLLRKYKFPDFATALAFVNRVGALAEAQGHHPDIALGWGRVEITLFTHSIGGLSQSDFVLAAKIDALGGSAS